MTAFMDQPQKKPEPVQIDPYLLNQRRLRKTSSEYFERRSSSLALPQAFRARAQSLMVIMSHGKQKEGKTKSKKAKSMKGTLKSRCTPYYLPRLTPLGLSSNLLKGVYQSAVLVLFTLGEPNNNFLNFSQFGFLELLKDPINNLKMGV